MAVPLPTEAEVKLEPPDAAEVHVIGAGLKGAVAPPAGLTDLQKVLITAVAHSLTGVTVDLDTLPPIGPTAMAERLRRRNALFRARIVQLKLLAALLLVPLPDDLAQ